VRFGVIHKSFMSRHNNSKVISIPQKQLYKFIDFKAYLQLIVQVPNQNTTFSDEGRVSHDFDYHLYG
jgi:hypothetical protein